MAHTIGRFRASSTTTSTASSVPSPWPVVSSAAMLAPSFIANKILASSDSLCFAGLFGVQLVQILLRGHLVPRSRSCYDYLLTA